MAKTYGNKIAVFRYLKFTDYVISEMIKIIYLKLWVKKSVCLAFIVPDLVSPTVVIWMLKEAHNPSEIRLPNAHTTSNPRRFDVVITSIRRRPNFDEFFWRNFAGRKIHVVSTHFLRRNVAGQKIHVVSTYFFRCNFNGRKIYVLSTYLFRCNFDGRKTHVVSTYFYWCNFACRKIHFVSTYFFLCNFDGRKIYVVSTYFFRYNSSGVISTYFFSTFL